MVVLRHYYHRLTHGVRNPMSLARKMFSLGLLNEEEKNQAITPQNVEPLCRTKILLGAVERRITAEKSAEPLRTFCQALENSPGLCALAEDMKRDLGGH